MLQQRKSKEKEAYGTAEQGMSDCRGVRSLGASVTKRFYQEGARLALTYRTTKLEMLDGELGESQAASCATSSTLRTGGRLNQRFIEIAETFSSVDVLVNCTGIVGPIGPLEILDIREWILTIDTNLNGSVHLPRAVIPIMKQGGRGKIILFSGGDATYGRPYFTPYSSSKAALVRLAESLAEELQSANIQVNAVAPGPVNSRMWTEMRAAAPAGGAALLRDIKEMDETGGASPERAAGLAAFLASDRSNCLTGRLLSAIWDDWEHLDGQMGTITSSDVWTLRRVPLSEEFTRG
jgi:3-oxoacyl-[acyl-carrier protein] reductase